MVAATAGAKSGVAYCADDYCTSITNHHMRMSDAKAYTLRYERWYLSELPARNFTVRSCEWRRKGILARCTVDVRMAIIDGEKGEVVVEWQDDVNRHGIIQAIPGANVIGLVDVTGLG